MDMSEFKQQLLSKDTESVIDYDAALEVLRGSYRPLTPQQNKNGTLNLVITMEELGELQQQVSKFIRGKDNHYELLEEVADAYFVLGYIRDICGLSDEEVTKAINIKLNRQAKRNQEETF